MERPSAAPGRPAVPVALALAWLGVALAIGMPAGAFVELLLEFDAGPAYGAWALAAVPLGIVVGLAGFSRTAGASQPRMILLGIAVFGIASLSSAASLTMPLLIAMRLVQGIGASLAVRVLHERMAPGTPGETARGVVTVAWGAGIGAGLVAGGLLSDTWQLPLAVPGFVAMAAFAVGWRTLQPPAAVETAGELSDDESLGRGRSVMLSLGMTAGAFAGVLLTLPLLLSTYHQTRSNDAALDLLPAAGGLLLSAVAAVYLAVKTGPRIPMIAGSWILLAATLTFHFTGVDWSPENIALLGAALSLGFSLSLAGLTWAYSTNAPARRSTLLPAVATQLGTALGLLLVLSMFEARETAESPIDGLFTGTAIAFSDAYIVAVVMAAVTFIVAVLQPPPRKATSEPEPVVVPRPRPVGPATWAVKPRAKPNSEGR